MIGDDLVNLETRASGLHNLMVFGSPHVSAAGYDRQGVADHANNLATKIRNNLTNSMKALGVDILTGFGSVLVSLTK